MSGKTAYKVKTDPELLRQVDSAALGSEPIQAVFTLSLPMKELLNPQKVKEAAYKIVKEVSEQVGETPGDVNVFENLGSFVISATPAFIRKLLSETRISAAVANKQPEGTFKMQST
jgi:hypothetical protein